MASLIVKKGRDEGINFEIRSSRFSLGRDLANDIQLLYPKVSRVHAEITYDDGTYVIADRESRNGTYVNGKKVKKKVLEDGDRIQLGDTVFLFMREKGDIAGSAGKIFDSTVNARETVIDTVPSWNVDLLKKNLISNSQLELQDTKRYLVDLYELTRKFPEFTDRISLLSYTADRIRDVIKADRVLPILRDPEQKDGWKVIGTEKMTVKNSLSSTPVSRTVFDRAVNENMSVIIHRDSPGEKVSESMIAYDIHTALCVPVAEKGDRGGIMGAFYADRLGEGENFNKMELEFVTACAIVASDALTDIERLSEHERHEHILRQEVRSRYNIVGESRTVTNMLDFIEKAGSSDAGVLIMGESGTGKELIARAIHYVGPRNAEVFKTCNCAALSETLLESELFGHVKGAFTGAQSEKAGVFEIADKGTLFLDEIGEMSPTGQAKLLRVLEQGEICRVGGSDVINVDVRVVAATNKDLEKEVEDGKFREDLFHRLNILTITAAPLRERKGDVKLLIDYYTGLFSSECGRKIEFTEEAVQALSEYSWPGNVRELKNFIERAFILSESDTIGKELLPPKIVYNREGKADDLKLETAVQNHIMNVLEIADGNKKKAASLLKIDRSTLYARLKQQDKEKEK